ncbi:hypothetical protein B0O80DRAFT_424067 [Mortierella sp. GBAus27b]|nr:hypothetical protein B0O80DRAFT_424067 [Mortierella sp. GBAus27b]
MITKHQLTIDTSVATTTKRSSKAAGSKSIRRTHNSLRSRSYSRQTGLDQLFVLPQGPKGRPLRPKAPSLRRTSSRTHTKSTSHHHHHHHSEKEEEEDEEDHSKPEDDEEESQDLPITPTDESLKVEDHHHHHHHRHHTKSEEIFHSVEEQFEGWKHPDPTKIVRAHHSVRINPDLLKDQTGSLKQSHGNSNLRHI